MIDSRNCYTLIQKGFVIPTGHNRVHEPIRTLKEIHAKDKAGMIVSPTENIGVPDYEYANFIIKNILSPFQFLDYSWNRFANVLVFEEINRHPGIG